jgi:hypothetical protein
MSERKELIRDMINSLINNDEAKATETFSQLSYAVAKNHLGIATEEPVEENVEDTPEQTDENVDPDATDE